MIPAPKLIGVIAAAGTLALSAVLRAGSQGAPGEAKGPLSFDDTPSSGRKADVKFDATLVKELKAAR